MDGQIIAILDDDTLVRESVARLVKSMRFKAELYSSPEELLMSGTLRDIRCIISDVNIGGGTTAHLQRRLTSIGHRIPIVFMTARLDLAKQAELLCAGAIGVLSKPFHHADVARCLAQALERTDAHGTEPPPHHTESRQ